MINILIADDHAILRGGLKQIIATTSDLKVLSEATHGQEVLEKIRDGNLHLLLLDMTMPGPGGVELIRAVCNQRPGLPILVLSMHNEAPVASRALRAGAHGYLTKDSDPEILLAAIRKVVEGGHFIDPTLVDALVFEQQTKMSPYEILSAREFQVLRMIASGQSVNDISHYLNLSAKTVSTYKTRLMEKLGLANNAELFRYAIENSLREPKP